MRELTPNRIVLTQLDTRAYTGVLPDPAGKRQAGLHLASSFHSIKFGGIMKASILLAAFCYAIFVGALSARADGTSPGDPKMITKTGAAGGCGSTPIATAPFTFTVDASGNSFPSAPAAPSAECFLNSGTSPITSLTVTTMDPPPALNSPCISSSYQFSGSPLFSFVSCTFNAQSALLSVTFFGTGNFQGANYPGVPVKTDFFMDLEGWNPNESFTGTANVAAPEPGSLMLLGLGLVVVIAGGRKKFGLNVARNSLLHNSARPRPTW